MYNIFWKAWLNCCCVIQEKFKVWLLQTVSFSGSSLLEILYKEKQLGNLHVQFSLIEKWKLEDRTRIEITVSGDILK